MSALSRDELLDVIRRSGLIAEQRLESLPSAVSAESLLSHLIEAGLLTAWQAERLQQSKSRGFFLGKYKLLEPLGAGAMGSVFLAEHRVMRHRVAIKVLARRLVTRPNFVVRFEREARAAAAVNHPNVVRAYDIDCEGETHYLVMEYVQGDNLDQIVEQQGPCDPARAAEYVRQAALGLHEAHLAGMIHRDIKPSNLLLDHAGVVKVLDLGLARMEGEDLPSVTLMDDSKLLGTVDYLAPEQALNSHRIDRRADIYSLGCTLYFLLTGSPPFPRGTVPERILKHQTRRPLDIRKRCADVPEPLVRICNRMMEKRPEQRYATALDAAKALAGFLAAESTADDHPSDMTLRLAEDSTADATTPDTIDASAASGSSDEFDLAEPGENVRRPAVATARPVEQLAATPSIRTAAPLDASIFDNLAPLPTSASSVFDSALPSSETLFGGPDKANDLLAAAPLLDPPVPQTDLPAQASAPRQNVEREDGINYPLWLLLIAGIILGLILAGVAFSYVSSFKKQDPRTAPQRKSD